MAPKTFALLPRSARVLIFPVTEANVVVYAARGVVAIKLEAKDRVIGFMLANKSWREGLTVRTNRGCPLRSSGPPSTPVTGRRGGQGYAILQRGHRCQSCPARPSRFLRLKIRSEECSKEARSKARDEPERRSVDWMSGLAGLRKRSLQTHQLNQHGNNCSWRIGPPLR